jgi:hypothetical protein
MDELDGRERAGQDWTFSAGRHDQVVTTMPPARGTYDNGVREQDWLALKAAQAKWPRRRFEAYSSRIESDAAPVLYSIHIERSTRVQHKHLRETVLQ